MGYADEKPSTTGHKSRLMSISTSTGIVFVSEVMNKAIVGETECAFGRIPDARLERIFRDIGTYHIDLPDLAELANDANVATLVMTHLVPSVEDAGQLELFFRQPASVLYNGNLVIAEDGTEVVIPLP